MHKYVRDGELKISEQDWSYLKITRTKEDIIELLSDLIDEHNLPMPMREITEREALDDFFALRNQNSSTLVRAGEFYSRYPYEFGYIDKYIDISAVGGKASDYFHQYSRWLCDSINSPSPYRCWHIKKFRTSLLGALWSLKHKEVNSNTLRSCIGLRKYIASQFRPSAAKAIYEYFGAKHVLDFSAGWGDRLAGFHAARGTESYLGIDPNARLQKGYDEQRKLYNTGKSSEVIQCPAEEFDFGGMENRFDTIFTSPPYFIVERYTAEADQSWQRYKKLENWLEHFLYKTIENATPTLKSGGHLILNISDVYCNHTINKICDNMNGKISTLGYEYVGGMGLRFPKRPNSNAEGKGIFCEPIWIWKKL
jgi:16S rRNA G966 N2-methylase RsmD